MHAELTLKLRNTFFCVVTFILPKRANPDFKSLSDKDQVSFMLCGSKTNTSENFNRNIIKIIIKYLKEIGRFENSLL